MKNLYQIIFSLEGADNVVNYMLLEGKEEDELVTACEFSARVIKAKGYEIKHIPPLHLNINEFYNFLEFHDELKPLIYELAKKEGIISNE